MRTRKSIINMAAGFFGQLLNLILAVVGRSILARYMPSEYLGINGLFSNVLSILSLADLGIGAAMMYALYSPVARENREEIRRLMNLYRLGGGGPGAGPAAVSGPAGAHGQAH